MGQSFENENKINGNETCEDFMNEVIMEKQAMEKKFEDNHNLQTKMNINPKNEEEIIKIN